MTRATLALTALVAALGGCSHATKEPYKAESRIETEATVESVDVPTRLVVLRGADGQRVSVVAGEEVRNLDQLSAGDRVFVTYYQGIAAEVKEPGEGGTAAEEQVDRAKPGEKPGGSASVTLRTVVEIVSVDPSSNTVTFRRPDGTERSVAVERPDAQKYIRTLSPGQHVEITYTEAMAIAVRPAR
ncbi:MAG: hypothetical protein IRZ28_09240 [Steroidobacteraceae bacterium]|nr:hypothetical protein [Steroidobacteraceae bacterium]